MPTAYLEHDTPPVEPFPVHEDPDAAYDRERQAEADGELTAEERRIAAGCLSTFILQLGQDLRRGGLTPEGANKYRQDMITAGQAIRKLMGVCQ